MTTTNPTGHEVLELVINDNNDAGVNTVREYLAALLELIWQEGEDFSGKRPFGNSGWEYELTEPIEARWPDADAPQLVRSAIDVIRCGS